MPAGPSRRFCSLRKLVYLTSRRFCISRDTGSTIMFWLTGEMGMRKKHCWMGEVWRRTGGGSACNLCLEHGPWAIILFGWDLGVCTVEAHAGARVWTGKLAAEA